MEVHQTDRKILLIGFQVSLIIHILLYIFLKLLPAIHLNYLTYQQPVEITIEEVKQQIQRVELSKPHIVENKRQETPPKQVVKETVKPEKVSQIAQKQDAVKPVSKQQDNSVQKSEKPAITVDDSNIALLSRITSSGVKQEEMGKNTEVSFGEPLSKFDKNIEGDAISRRVIYKPAPIKVETDVPQPSVKVKIFIAPSGDVMKVQLLTLTSDPAINREVVSYMLKWKFNRIDENAVQYAVLTVYFTR